MDKNETVELSAPATTALPAAPAPAAATTLTNWAGNLAYSTNNIYYPGSVTEVCQLVNKHKRLKALGSRHCFNHIADSQDVLLALQKLNKVIALDTQACQVTVEGGINYGQLAHLLQEKGFALHNLASLPHISVAGACLTATHGSGVKNANLATAVSALTFVAADGQEHTLSREKDGDSFRGAVVSLGALGIITRLTLDVEPSFSVQQYVYENLPLQALQEHFYQIVAGGYSVSLFTDWQSSCFNEVWIKIHEKEKASWQPGPLFFGARAATENMHPIAHMPAENCTEQMGVPGPWHERLPHFRMGFTPSSGQELQSEYFVSLEHGLAAVLAVAKLGQQLAPHLLISEIRTIAADDLWLSPCYKQACLAIHFTWKQDWPAVSKLLPVIEAALAPFNVKPHWGKLFTLPAKVLQQRYEKMQDFKGLAAAYDPKGKFRNAFLNQYIFND